MASKNLPLVEQTKVRGVVELKFPGIEVSFPATNRSFMVIAMTALLAFTVIVPICFYEVFNAKPESLETVGDILRGRKPEKVPVKNVDGDIEMIEVCPPCPACENFNCPACPICTQCQEEVINQEASAPEPPLPAMAPYESSPR